MRRPIAGAHYRARARAHSVRARLLARLWTRPPITLPKLKHAKDTSRHRCRALFPSSTRADVQDKLQPVEDLHISECSWCNRVPSPTRAVRTHARVMHHTLCAIALPAITTAQTMSTKTPTDIRKMPSWAFVCAPAPFWRFCRSDPATSY